MAPSVHPIMKAMPRAVWQVGDQWDHGALLWMGHGGDGLGGRRRLLSGGCWRPCGGTARLRAGAATWLALVSSVC